MDSSTVTSGDSGIGDSGRQGTVVVPSSPLDNESAPLLESPGSENAHDVFAGQHAQDTVLEVGVVHVLISRFNR